MMIEGSLGLFVEGLVSILLVATIFYCISVNKKLERLRDEQQGMHNFIRELSIATANADKAIQGLRLTVQDSGAELAGQIDKGRNMKRALKSEIENAGQTMNKLIILTGSAQKAMGAPPTNHPAEIERAPAPQAINDLRSSMLGFDDLDRETAAKATAKPDSVAKVGGIRR